MIITINPTGTIEVTDRVGGQIDTTETNQQEHTAQALGRLIEFWKSKPNMRALMADYITELDELENVIWQIILQRFPDNAGTAQLDVLGKIVGEDRDGLGDADYLVRIRARIRANSSYGTGKDVIDVLRLITDARFRFVRTGTASFEIRFTGVPTDSVMRQAPSLVDDTRAAGVGSSVLFVTDAARGGLYGSEYDGLNASRGYGSIHDASVGGLYGHQV